MTERQWRHRPDVEKAHYFEIGFCEVTTCGLHLIPFRRDDTPICEVVMSEAATREMIKACQDMLYARAASRDG